VPQGIFTLKGHLRSLRDKAWGNADAKTGWVEYLCVAGGGGGGGLSHGAWGTYQAGSGGSGIVIVRFPSTFAAAASTTGSPTYTSTGGWHVYKFTANGSITL
jgi:hypothetical protein